MDKKNISPNPQQPVDRVPTGQLPIERSEANGMSAMPSDLATRTCTEFLCSYDGDDE
ncbi:MULTISPECIES: DUF5837 family cyanobactin class RiPP [Limnospira]|uniref:DUF5837 family cyanobactin class RiPP n=1 Tax=Limnospira fusiformis PMC 851.14 TaxID=2219512 RepID=A0ABU9EI13_LIMFS|nr:bacteriocin leader peptide, microcyclamide/patellamide family [Arthrospira platensis C1]